MTLTNGEGGQTVHSALRDIAEFTSKKFSPRLPEECQVNPGVYGAELAYWLCTELAGRGIVTTYPEAEDWGWYIEYSTPAGSEFAVHCGNAEGGEDRWLLSLFRHARKMFGRDRPPYDEAAPLVDAIRALLAETESITDVEWRFHEDGAPGERDDG